MHTIVYDCMHFLFLNIRLSLIILFTHYFFVVYSQNRSDIITNPHVKYTTEVEGNYYTINYTFKDQFNNFQHYTISYPSSLSDQMIRKFGIPNWMFEKYIDNIENRAYRQGIIKNGLFKQNGDIIEVDKSAVIDYYSKTFCKPIAELIIQSLADYGKDNRNNRIEFAMRFVQDIPYGIPDFSYKNIHFGGVSPPSKMLIEGYGDCDSKVLLFVGILINLIDSDDILFLNQQKHILTAIKATPKEGSIFIKHQEGKYLLAETSGPGHRNLGEKGNYYQDSFEVERLSINPITPLEYGDNENPKRSTTEHIPVDENAVLINNSSQKDLHFQLSYDNIHWEEFYLREEQAGMFVLEEEGEILLRLISRKTQNQTYQIQSGKSYSINWNSRKRKWEWGL